MPLTTLRLTSAIGAEISGVDLSTDLSEATVAEIREALLDHQVLVFRDQDLTTERHIAFARHFGEIMRPPVRTAHGGPPEINVLDQTRPRGEGADNWHADNRYTKAPPMGSLLRVLELPSVGGDTGFASMTAAYDALSEPVRRLCDELTAVHDLTRSVTKAIARGHSAANLAEMQAALPPVEHPVVIAHPVTGRSLLYVNPGFTVGIEGWSRGESKALLGFLYEHASRPEFQTRFQWAPGSLALWDNRSTWHFAVNDYHGHRLYLHRITVAGSELAAAF